MIEVKTNLPPSEVIVAKKSAAKALEHMTKWARETTQRIHDGEPFIVLFGLPPIEIIIAMDLCFRVHCSATPVYYGNALVPEEGHVVLPDLPDDGGFDELGMCGRCGMVAPGLGTFPKFSAIIRREGGCSGGEKAVAHWSRQYGVPVFNLDATDSTPFYPRYQRWWENLEDQWDEILEPHRIDYRTQELKALIKFLETTTGKTFSQKRFEEVMEQVNEGGHWVRKAFDLIARTSPYPVGIADFVNIYPVWQQRGSPGVADVMKTFYEEVKERVDSGEALCQQEKIRLQWVSPPLYGNMPFYRSFEDKYSAVFGTSFYPALPSDQYPRSIVDKDPLRALAGRNLFPGLFSGPAWDIKLAKQHGVHASVMQSGGPFCPVGEGIPPGPRRLHEMAYKAAGIPLLILDITMDPEKMKEETAKFIEKL